MKIFRANILFCISSFFIFGAGLFTYSDENAIVDINIHDTYYIIHLFHFITLIALVYFFIGSIYWVFKKLKISLSRNLTLTHLICSIGGILLYVLLMAMFEDDTEVEPGVFNESSLLGYAIFGLIALILFSQIIFILNLVIGIVKKFKC